jgi:hypothetical protein
LFRDVVGHFEYLRGLLVQQCVVVAEMPPGHAPMKILGLHVKREDIRQQHAKLVAYFFDATKLLFSPRFCI